MSKKRNKICDLFPIKDKTQTNKQIYNKKIIIMFKSAIESMRYIVNDKKKVKENDKKNK